MGGGKKKRKENLSTWDKRKKYVGFINN